MKPSQRRRRLRTCAISWGLCAFFLSATAPSHVPTGDLPGGAPDAREAALLEALAAWVDDANGAAPAPIRQRIRENAESFDIFRRFPTGQARLDALARRPYGKAIIAAADRHAVDPLLVAAIVTVESRFDPEAVSYRGAVGLMQVLPSTAALPDGELADPQVNLDAGVGYLGWLLQSFEGELELALAAYNAGPTSVRRFGGVPPFEETQAYVEKVLAVYVELNREAWRVSEEATLVATVG